LADKEGFRIVKQSALSEKGKGFDYEQAFITANLPGELCRMSRVMMYSAGGEAEIASNKLGTH
jgi:hypothetical protein